MLSLLSKTLIPEGRPEKESLMSFHLSCADIFEEKTKPVIMSAKKTGRICNFFKVASNGKSPVFLKKLL
jgi:hypothetical protein